MFRLMGDAPSMAMLLIGAAAIGLIHTAASPGHYLPFVAIGKSRGWSLPKTLAAVFACGGAHMLSSLILGLAGVLIGLGAGAVEHFQNSSGGVAKLLFLIFATAYFICGLRKASAGKCARSWTKTIGGSDISDKKSQSILREPTFWALFAVFILGPCEMLAPLLIYPSSHMDWFCAAAITVVFSGVTIATMLALVCLLWIGADFISLKKLNISAWSDAMTGAILWLCSLFMLFAH